MVKNHYSFCIKRQKSLTRCISLHFVSQVIMNFSVVFVLSLLLATGLCGGGGKKEENEGWGSPLSMGPFTFHAAASFMPIPIIPIGGWGPPIGGGWGAPPYQAPQAYPTPSYPTPSYPTPSYSAPSYSAPAYPTPSYSDPSYSAPAYSAPAYPTPSYSAPAYSAPAYQPLNNPAYGNSYGTGY